jgi:hypothetical protein
MEASIHEPEKIAKAIFSGCSISVKRTGKAGSSSQVGPLSMLLRAVRDEALWFSSAQRHAGRAEYHAARPPL